MLLSSVMMVIISELIKIQISKATLTLGISLAFILIICIACRMYKLYVRRIDEYSARRMSKDPARRMHNDFARRMSNDPACRMTTHSAFARTIEIRRRAQLWKGRNDCNESESGLIGGYCHFVFIFGFYSVVF